MSLFDRFISTLAPYECLACGIEGDVLCADCMSQLQTVPQRCYRCRKVSAGALTCPACRHASKLYRVQVAVVYQSKAKELVWKLKFGGAQTAAELMAQCMRPFIDQAAGGALIVPIPTATSRVRRRGYDQAELLAQQLARRTRLRYSNCLARRGQAQQVGTSRRERLTQLVTAFRVSRPQTVRGACILLVDDVVTTGATLEVAAIALKKAGATQISAIVFAQP